MILKHNEWYVFCDICGRRCFASETYRLGAYTGREGLVVCKADKDEIDAGLIPYKPRTEQFPEFIRLNHTNTTNGSPVFDFEDNGQDFNILSTSQGDYLSTSQGSLIII